MNKLFVGNLAWDTTEEELREHFESCGHPVESSKIVSDKNTGKSKGFGFVNMETAEGAKAAIDQLNDKPLRSRNLRVSLAQERQERPARPEGRGGFDRGRGGGSSDYSKPQRPYYGSKTQK